MQFAGSHILSVHQFERSDVERIFSVADRMGPYARRRRVTRVLDGAILGSMFFEPSTRTRVSFGSAFNLLGGEVRETTGIENSAIAKGESLYDTARVLSGYSDVIAMRHPDAGSVAEFAAASRVPVINGGDGSNEHPSQALLDLYTISSELAGRGRSIDDLRIAMVGDLRFGRTVHSLSKLLCLFDRVQVTLVSPRELRMPGEIIEEMREAGIEVIESDALEASISQVDIVYSTRIQEERFSTQAEADLYRGRYRLNQSIYTHNCEPHTVIMHPLPRDSRNNARELDDDLNDNPNLAIFRQTDNGMLVRMALFALILDVVEQVDQHATRCELVHGGSILMSLELTFGAQDVRILADEDAFSGYFSVRRLTLQHRCFAGGWSEPLVREIFERGDAVGVLPYDPISDTVVLIEQFRAGALRGDASPWMLELIAGVVESGEDDEQVAHREALEEADCELSELLPIATVLPSAGACTEQVRLFCGRVSKVNVGGIHGLEEEGEDILVHSVTRKEALQLVTANRIPNGHTLIALQWLHIHGDSLRERWG